MRDFFDLLREKYDVDDFTGNIGVILDEGADEDERESALDFLQDVYRIAVESQ